MKNLWMLGFLMTTGTAMAQDYYEVSPVGIDERYDHFMPVIYGTRIVFSSTNADEDVIKYTDKNSAKTPSSIFVATMQEGKLMDKPELLAKNIRTNFHEGPATFSSDGRTMLFTRNLYTKKYNYKKNKNKLGIFLSEYKDGHWTEPQEFEHNNPKYSVGHPALSKDGKKLYFVSNMPGGSGGTDIYSCNYKNGKWDTPENLGTNINSSSNELFPVVDKNKIYFSSDRSGGIGALDIYSSIISNGSCSEPIALPAPLNSTADDMGFAPLPDNRTGYLSSNRNGHDQIFFFKRTVPIFVDCQPQVENNYCYLFSEEKSISSDSLPLVYQWDLGDGSKKYGPVAEHCYNGSGSYTVQLNIIDTITQNIFFNEATYQLDIVDEHQPYISVQGNLNIRQQIQFSAINSRFPDKKVAEYHWDLGNGVHMEGIEAKIKYREPGELTIKLDVIFEPDETGRIEHQCVTRIIELLDTKQILEVSNETTTIEYADAQGEVHTFTYQELPYDLFSVAVNDGEDVFFTVELMTSKERISTADPFFQKASKKYTILENYISAKDHFSYSIGKTKTLAGTYAIYTDLLAMKYGKPEVKAVLIEKVKKIGNPEDMAALEQLNVTELNNTVLRMSTVYFGSGDYRIAPEFEATLDKLLAVITAIGKIDLEISAHTDNVGPGSFNKLLSERRAYAIVEYLESKGFDRARTKAIGYGEDKPIASNNSEEGKQLNRRVEFKLISSTLLSSEK